MLTFRFIGDVALLHLDGTDVHLDTFGEKVEVPEGTEKTILTQVLVLPEADFKAIGFTDAELVKYPTSVEQAGASQTFKSKQSKAVAKYLENRSAALSAVATVPAAPSKSAEVVPEQVAPQSTQNAETSKDN